MLDEGLKSAVHGHVVQTETLTDLELGHFDAVTTVGRAFGGCTLGLGVAAFADGEIVAVDGEVWRVPADGRPVPAPLDLGLPFAVAALGGTAHDTELPAGLDLDGIGRVVDTVRQREGDCRAPVVAVRVDGEFSHVLLRSEPRQEPPFQLLSDVLDHEVRFAFERWTGSLVGFRFDNSGDGRTIPGLHLHAIAADRGSGGHCRAVTVIRASLRTWIDDVRIVIPGAAGEAVTG